MRCYKIVLKVANSSIYMESIKTHFFTRRKYFSRVGFAILVEVDFGKHCSVFQS